MEHGTARGQRKQPGRVSHKARAAGVLWPDTNATGIAWGVFGRANGPSEKWTPAY